jgi:hypothetical protein
MRKFFILATVLLASLGSHAQCFSTNGPFSQTGAMSVCPSGTNLVIVPGLASALVNTTINYTALQTLNGAGTDVTSSASWASSNTAIATVASSGNPRVVTCGSSTGTTVITATSNGITAQASLLCNAPPNISTVTLPGALTNNLYDSGPIVAVGGALPYTWTLVSGSLPPGLTLNDSSPTASITGTPTVNGVYTFTIRVTENGGAFDDQIYTLVSAGNGPTPPDSALLTWCTSIACTPTSNVSICVGTPANAAALPGGGCAVTYNIGNAAQDLTNALNNAACGQVINISVRKYLGNFAIPTGLTCPLTNWIWITGDLSVTGFPAEGNRVDPNFIGLPHSALLHEQYPTWDNGSTVARKMPQLIAKVTNANPTLYLSVPNSANLTRSVSALRIQRLELTRDESADVAFSIFSLNFMPSNTTAQDCAFYGGGNVTLPSFPINPVQCTADQAQYVVFSQNVVHGDSERQTVVGYLFGGCKFCAVQDNYFYDFNGTFAGGTGDSQAIGGGTGKGVYCSGDWKVINNYLEGSTENSLIGGAYVEPFNPTVGCSGIPQSIWFTQNYRWKNPLWMVDIGHAQNETISLEGQTYGPSNDPEFFVTPHALTLQVNQQFQIQDVWLNDISGGFMRGNTPSGLTPTTTCGTLTQQGAHNIGVAPFVATNMVDWVYTAPAAPTTCTITYSFKTNNDLAGHIGQTNVTLTDTVTVTVVSGTPTKQIAVSPKAPDLVLQPGYSDPTNFNTRNYCMMFTAFPNYSPTSITWDVDGTTNGSAALGTITAVSGSTFSGTSPSIVAYCAPTTTSSGSHVIRATTNDAIVDSSTVTITTSAPIVGYDLKPVTSKNLIEFKEGDKIRVDHELMETSFGSNGNGGKQSGECALLQAISDQAVDYQGAHVTAWSIVSNVVTFTAVNTFTAGQRVQIGSLAHGVYMNTQIVTVLASGLSGTQFQANFTHADDSATESGVAVHYVGFGPQQISNVFFDHVVCSHTGQGLVIVALSVGKGTQSVLIQNMVLDDNNMNRWSAGGLTIYATLQVGGTNSTTVPSWTSPTNPLYSNISFDHNTIVGGTATIPGVTYLLSVNNNIAQFTMGPFTMTNSIMQSNGNITFTNLNGGTASNCAISGPLLTVAGSTEANTFKGAGYNPPKPCFTSYTITPNLLLDSTINIGNVFTSTPIFTSASTASNLFSNYNAGNNGVDNIANYALVGGSPYINAGSDGLNLGADIAGDVATVTNAKQGTRTP